MPTSDRTLLALLRYGFDVVDGFSRRVGGELRRLVSMWPLTQQTRPALMQQIDRVLDRAFGLTKRAALTGELFRTILGATDRATAAPFDVALVQLRRIVTTRDPMLWERIRGIALLGGNDPFLRSLRAMEGSIAERVAFLRTVQLKPNAIWVKSDGYRLSQRVWKQGQDVRRQIHEQIEGALRRGDDVATVTKSVERILIPRYLSATFALRRLAQTEIVHAHGQAVIASARTMPGSTGVQWKLHAAHLHQDECNDHASRDDFNLGMGVYPVNEVPVFPSHPLCKCRLERSTLSNAETFSLIAERYGS